MHRFSETNCEICKYIIDPVESYLAIYTYRIALITADLQQQFQITLLIRITQIFKS